jgi:excisionase family DNA binding protein
MKRKNTSPVQERRALNVSDFCEVYSVGRSTVYELVRAGKLPDIKIAGRRIIPVDAAEALLHPKEPV